MSKYRCISCDHVFEMKNDAKPRCPQCLRVHDLEPVAEAGAPKPAKRWAAPLLVLLVAAAVAVVYFFFVQRAPQGDKTAPSEASELEKTIAGLGLDKADTTLPFAQTEAVAKFAADAASGKQGQEALQALMDAISALGKSGKWKRSPQREPRQLPPLVADALVGRFSKPEKEPLEALSYELASLLLAAARSLDVDARMAEIRWLGDPKRPADSEGKLGRFGVTLGGKQGDKDPPLFDPFTGLGGPSLKASFQVLSDEEAVAPFFGLKALSKLLESETATAMKLNSAAVKLSPNNPYFRISRAAIFDASGAPPDEVLAELEKAVKLRGDAVTRTSLAEALFAVDLNGKRSEEELLAALQEMPDYARAHALMATVHIRREELSEAEAELQKADRLEPGSAFTALCWAQLYMAQSKTDQAIAKAEEAARLSNDGATYLLGLAGIYRMTARFDEMRKALDRAYEKAGSSASFAARIESLFRYNPADKASEKTEAQAGAGSSPLGSPGGLELKLGQDSPSTMGGTGLKLGSDGPGLGGGKPSLGGEGLKLDLNLKK